MPSGYCMMCTSGKAPPSPKCSSVRGMKPPRRPYAGAVEAANEGTAEPLEPAPPRTVNCVLLLLLLLLALAGRVGAW